MAAIFLRRARRFRSEEMLEVKLKNQWENDLHTHTRACAHKLRSSTPWKNVGIARPYEQPYQNTVNF